MCKTVKEISLRKKNKKKELCTGIANNCDYLTNSTLQNFYMKKKCPRYFFLYLRLITPMPDDTLHSKVNRAMKTQSDWIIFV